MNVGDFTVMGTLSLLDYSRKHRERLAAEDVEDADEVAAALVALESTLQSRYAARRPLQSEWLARVAAKDSFDDALDALLAIISYSLLAPTTYDRDRSHPGYRAIFPSGNLDFTRGPDREQVSHVRAVIAYLQTHPDHPAAPQLDALTAAVDAFDKALDAQAAAAATLKVALGAERVARKALVKQLRHQVRTLRMAFDGDEARVNAMFASPPSPRATAEDDEPVGLDA